MAGKTRQGKCIATWDEKNLPNQLDDVAAYGLGVPKVAEIHIGSEIRSTILHFNQLRLNTLVRKLISPFVYHHIPENLPGGARATG